MAIPKKEHDLCSEKIKITNLTAKGNLVCRRQRYKPDNLDCTHKLIFNGFGNLANFITTLGVNINHKDPNRNPRLLFEKIKPPCSNIYLFKA
tara:strand:- start:11 stop:286 length:276 start_codon:yes stop_codon:yes gene_type:complete